MLDENIFSKKYDEAYEYAIQSISIQKINKNKKQQIYNKLNLLRRYIQKFDVGEIFLDDDFPIEPTKEWVYEIWSNWTPKQRCCRFNDSLECMGKEYCKSYSQGKGMEYCVWELGSMSELWAFNIPIGLLSDIIEYYLLWDLLGQQ